MNQPWSTPAILNSKSQVSLFDDFMSANINNNNVVGSFFRQTGNNGGGVTGGVVGVDTPGVAGRFGIITPLTGTTANATGQGIIDATTAQVYCGMAGITMQWGFKITTLATAGVDYVLEMGFGNGYVSGGTGTNNSALIVYKRSVSTNFNFTTGNSASLTTAGDAAAIAVGANTWYNGKIVLRADGTGVDFYIATAGSAYVSLGSSTTNLPSLAQQCNPVFNIYKASSSATSSTFMLDWAQLDITGLIR